MLLKFWEGLGDKLAERWLALLFSPALLFWAGGLLVWIDRFDWNTPHHWWTGLPLLAQGLALCAVPLLVIASAALGAALQGPLLRLLEGYWPTWAVGLADDLVAGIARRRDSDEQRYQKLAQSQDTLGRHEREELARLEIGLREIPVNANDLLPTRLGCLLRAAERKPAEKYGLDGVICWSRLWLLLPEATRGELNAARSALDKAVNLWLWGLLFIVWTPLSLLPHRAVATWWPLCAGLVVMLIAYRQALAAARTFGLLLEAAFDLYRWSLYQSLGWRLPATPAQERESGAKLTQYLWRGADGPVPRFVHPRS